MSSGRRTLAKNASVLLASQLITWALALLIALYLPRYLRPEALGQFAIAIAIWAIVSVFLTFGMDTFLTKSIAREPSKTPELIVTSMVVRTILFLFGSVIVWAYLQVFHFSSEVQTLTLIVGGMAYCGVLTSGLTAALYGLERMEFVSISLIVMKGVTAALSFLCIFLGLGVYWVAGANVLAMFTGLVIVLGAVLRLYPMRLRFDAAAGWAMLRNSSPYLVTGMTIIVYQQVDQLFIAKLVDAKAVGYYSTAQTLFGTLLFVPTVFGTVIFPMLSRSYATAQGQMDSIVRRSIDLMFFISIPIGFGVAITAEPLILLIYRAEFLPAGQILSVFGVVCTFTYLNTLLGQLLISMDRTARLNIIMIGAIIATVPLDLLLVPWCARVFQNGALGGAISFLITEFCVLVISLLLLPKHTLAWSNVRTAALVVVAGSAMIIVSNWFRDTSLILAIVLGAISYFILVIVLRVIPRSDWQILFAAAQSVIARVRGRRSTPVQVSGD